MPEDKQVSIRVQLDESLRNRLKGKAALQGKTLNQAVEQLIEEYVADMPEESARTSKK
jgi:predicted HicB family RNase H-like nuclease